jgi:signal transduction histidine kinase
MTAVVTLDRYAEVLAEHVAGAPSELSLLHAYDLGRQLVEEGAGLLDVVGLHGRAVAQLEAATGVTVPRVTSEAFLSEVLGPFEMAYLGFQEANTALRTLTASLEEQVADRTRQLQDSLSELQALDAERRRLLARLVTAQEGERHRLANDLHDDTIQTMTAASMRLAGLRRWLDDEAQPKLDRLEDTVVDAISRLRRLIFELRPPALDYAGIGAAVEVYGQTAFEEDLELLVDDDLEEQPPIETREILYRIVQEALANCRKHAQASRVEVTVRRHRNGVQVRVVDDGTGFDERLLDVNRPGHLGVSAMRERAQMAGGWCTITSTPGTGTVVTCWLPHHVRTTDAT